MNSNSSELAASSTLQLRLNTYPASRWQQLRQTLGAGSNTVPAQLRASAPGLSGTGNFSKQLRISHSVHQQHGREAGLSQPDLLQEAADVLRRCTDTGAALQAHETQLAAAALDSLGQHSSSKDQFTILGNGSMRTAWADADKPLEQWLAESGSAAFACCHACEATWADSLDGGCLYASTTSATDAAAVFANTQQDSQPAADRSPPRRTSPRKQQQQLVAKQHQQQHLHTASLQTRPQQHSGSSLTTSSAERGSTNSSSRMRSTLARPAAAAAGMQVLAEHDKLLLQELTHDLAALLARKLLRQWQQHTADARIDRARARPMQRVLRWAAMKAEHHERVCSVPCSWLHSLCHVVHVL